jgi:hypothetical protein
MVDIPVFVPFVSFRRNGLAGFAIFHLRQLRRDKLRLKIYFASSVPFCG